LRLARWFYQFRDKSNRSLLVKLVIALPGEFFQSLWGVYAMFRYDVFIFGFGKSLLRSNLDLPILRVLGKTVISNLAHGSEARPPFINGATQTKEGVPASLEKLRSSALRSRKRVAMHVVNSSFVIGAPFSTTHFVSSRLINWFALGVPFHGGYTCEDSYQELLTSVHVAESRPIRILHSPSHPALKGSSIIFEAIKRLKQRGHAIEFILIHGRPFKEVMEEIQRCDFVIDQLYSDTPMAGFATESAWFGKPAVVGGYGLDRLKGFVPDSMWPPSKTCSPDQFEQAIEELIVDVEQRQRLGREAQAFVRDRWSAVEVARRYLWLIEGDIPEEWWLDPNDVIYVEGCGQSVAQSQQTIRDLVAAHGVESLQLSQRPELEAAFLEFAGIQLSN